MTVERITHLVQERVKWGRATSHRALDKVPGLRRLVSDLARIELIDRSMIIAAQALFALVPLLIVLWAFIPHEFAVALSNRFQAMTGLDKSHTAAVRQSLTPNQIRAATGVFGLLLTLFSATSFSRALQRMYERVWQVPQIKGPAGLGHGLLWLIGWIVGLQLVAVIGATVLQARLGPIKLVAQIGAASLLWWWSARILLAGRVPWRKLLPGALISGFALTVYGAVGRIWMPQYAATGAKQLGALGVVLAVATWLVGVAAVMVVAAVLGRVVAEEEHVHREAARLAAAGRTALRRSRGRSA